MVARAGGRGLSARLMMLTIATVMVIELTIYVPSVVSYRTNWLTDRLAAARIAALVLEAAPSDMVPEALVARILDGVGALGIAMRIEGARRLLARADMPLPMAERRYDLRDMSFVSMFTETFDTLIGGRGRVVTATGVAPMNAEFVEIVFDETPLHEALIRFSGNVLLLSLLLSGLTGGALYLALLGLIVRPVRRLIASIVAFKASPEEAGPADPPHRRTDEIGAAEQELAAMQRVLSREFAQRKRLAELGLAVNKISHDLRNMLTSAQLVSDQLTAIADPRVQRFAPTLIHALDRAIAFCESTLAFGAPHNRPPAPVRTEVRDLLEEVGRSLPALGSIELRLDVRPGLEAEIDPLTIFRAVLNLARNAAEALRAQGAGLTAPTLTIEAGSIEAALRIVVADNGPGVPARVRENLFRAFPGGGRQGGSGLGLAIAHELVREHGGELKLLDTEQGAAFEIILPGVVARARG